MKKWLDFVRRQLQKHFPKAKSRQKSQRLQRNKDRLGTDGEKRARRFLKSLGYKILDTNVRYEDGELDIVAKDRAMTVFVEVKTRRPHPNHHPSMAVTDQKQQKIKQLAFRYLGPASRQASIRFDVIAITWPENGEPVVEHFMDAFR